MRNTLILFVEKQIQVRNAQGAQLMACFMIQQMGTTLHTTRVAHA